MFNINPNTPTPQLKNSLRDNVCALHFARLKFKNAECMFFHNLFTGRKNSLQMF